MDALYARSPRAYRASVRRWVLIGSAAYAGLFVLAILVAVAIYFMRGGRVILAIFEIFLVAAIVSSFRLRVPKSRGLRLSRESAPMLFGAVDDLADELGTAKIDTLLLRPDPGAFASQVGGSMLGKPRLVVALGIGLLVSLSEEELKSVIAHELAHHAAGDVGHSFAVGKVMERWNRFAQKADVGWMMAPFRSFIDWYVPRLRAVTLANSRQKELAADAVAARVVGVEATAVGLARLGSLDVWGKALNEKQGSFETRFDQFIARAKEFESLELDHDEVLRSIDERYQHQSSYLMTHPSLSQRLDKLGYGADQWPILRDYAAARPAIPAARAFFGDQWNTILDTLAAEYRGEFATWDSEEHEAESTLVEYDKSLLPKIDRDFVLAKELFFEGKYDDAAPILEEICRELPASNDAKLWYATALARGSGTWEKGLELLKELVADPWWALDALNESRNVLEERGRHQDAYELSWEIEEASRKREEAYQYVVELKRSLSAPRLQPQVIADTIASIAENRPEVKMVISTWQSNQRVPGTVIPAILVVVKVRQFGRSYEARREHEYRVAQELIDQVDIPFNGVVNPRDEPPPNVAELRSAGSVLYERLSQ